VLQKISFILSIILSVSAVCSDASAQIGGEEMFAVRDSKLAAVNLPGGAQQVKDDSVPGEIKDTLAKMVAAGGDKVRQGDSEVVVWTGNYKKSSGLQMIKNLENTLKSSGWEYEIGEKSNEFVLFTLFRTAPARRALVGFFVPSEDGFVLALTEMLASGAPANETHSEKELPRNVSNRGNAGNVGDSPSVVGKWSRSEGGGSIDYTGKTQYKSGITYTFEFFADGTVEYVSEKDVLSIIQCRTKASDKARGKYAINGNTMTINLGAASSVGSSTCEKNDNYNRTLPAATLTKKFTVKRMDSITRPDKPWILCFDGQDGDGCFEKRGN
jgi:hypothetical protein